LGFTRCDLHRLPGEENTVTGLYYEELLGRFAADLQKIRPRLAKKKVLLHHDNAPAHTFALAKAKLVELGYELLPHPPYYPDLAACNFFFVSKLEKVTRWTEICVEVVAVTEACFADLEKTYFSDGLKKLGHRWVNISSKRRLC